MFYDVAKVIAEALVAKASAHRNRHLSPRKTIADAYGKWTACQALVTTIIVLAEQLSYLGRTLVAVRTGLVP